MEEKEILAPVSRLPFRARFLHVAPQYFFYNLPASESKDILQSMLNEGSSHPQLEQQEHLEDNSNERCIVQWLAEEATSRTCCTLRLLSTGLVFSRCILAISSLLTIHTKFNSNIVSSEDLQFAVFLFPYSYSFFI